MMPLLIRGAAAEEAEHAARTRLEEVGLENRAGHRAGELSGGEQQRVALARALAGNPEILLADEPTGNLDAKTGEMVMSLLEQAQHLHNLTLLYVTHNSAFFERADRRLHFEKGQASPTWKTPDDSIRSARAGEDTGNWGGSTHHV
jgi:lipoprotein-releasing system ATP-binding protein